MFEINLPSNDLSPRPRHARSERTETTTGILRAGVGAIGKGIVALSAAHTRWRLRRATVRSLDALPDRILRDIGIPRSQIWTIASHLVNTAARIHVPDPAPPRRTATHRNRPDSGPHLATPTAACCG